MGFVAVTRAAGLTIVAALCTFAAAATHNQGGSDLQPAVRIPVAPLGFLPPSSFYLTYRLSSTSFGFLDDSHLLFTFRTNGLLRRIPGDPPNDDDQEIRAVVLDTATGRIARQADWRMHDRSQYLWPLADRKFLVRVRDSLFLTDASLDLKPYLRLASPLRSIQVSADRRWLIIETTAPETSRDAEQDPAQGNSATSESLGTGKPVRVAVVAAGSDVATLISNARSPVAVPILGDSLLDTLEGHQISAWMIRAVPLHGTPRTLVELKSGCEPTLQPVSATVALVMGCFGGGDQRPVVAISSKGEQLWRQRWESKYVWPWFTSAQNGTRFAYESVEVAQSMSTFQALYPEDVVAQWVGVYDTETGKLVLVKKVTPVLTAGQNVALSPDGRRFAVLRDGAIEIYDLPPVEPRVPETSNDHLQAQKKTK
jgi:hypothetical protein